MRLYWEQVHESMDLYVVFILAHVYISLSIFYRYTLHRLDRKHYLTKRSYVRIIEIYRL